MGLAAPGIREAIQHGASDVDLVSIGVGEVEVPAELAGRVIDLGFLPDGARNDAFAAAVAYVQPSRMESFSRTIMEAWLAGTPVLAIEGSQVVAWHCRALRRRLHLRRRPGARRHVASLTSDVEAGLA